MLLSHHGLPALHTHHNVRQGEPEAGPAGLHESLARLNAFRNSSITNAYMLAPPANAQRRTHV